MKIYIQDKKKSIFWIVFFLLLYLLYMKVVYIEIFGAIESSYALLVALATMTLIFSLKYFNQTKWHFRLAFYCIPFGAYTYISYLFYWPSLFAWFLFSTILSIGLVFYFFDFLRKYTLKRNLQLLVYIIGVFSLILCTAVGVNGFLYEKGVFDSMKKEVPVTHKSEVRELNIIDDEEAFKKLSVDEKYDLAMKIAEIEKKALGIEDKIEICVEDLGENFGQAISYYSEKKVILNSRFISSSDLTGYELIDIIAHEMRHIYQNELIDLYESVPLKKRQLLLFKNTGILDYKENRDNYIDSDENYEEYFTQVMEEDARN